MIKNKRFNTFAFLFILIFFTSCAMDYVDTEISYNTTICDTEDYEINEIADSTIYTSSSELNHIIYELLSLNLSQNSNYINERHRIWSEDIIYLREQVLSRHPKFREGIHRRFSDDEQSLQMALDFDIRIQYLLQNITYITDFEVHVQLQRAIAIFRDSHLGFTLRPYNFTRNLLTYRYPLSFGFFYDGFYLYRSNERFEKALNHRLVYINGIEIDEILYNFSNFWSVENMYGARYAFARAVSLPNFLIALGVSGCQNGTTYTFIDSNGTHFDIYVTIYYDRAEVQNYITMSYRKEGDIPLFYADFDELDLLALNREEATWFEFLEDYGILYIRVHTFRHGTWLRDIIDLIDNGVVQCVIIDVRGNPGGRQDTHDAMFRYIAANIAPDRLFYFIDEGTGSQAIFMASYLKTRHNATIIGQPAKQNINFYISLPSTVIHLNYSNDGIILTLHPIYLSFIHGLDFYDGIFRPHVIIDYTIEDWINNRDPLLDYVKETLIKSKR